MKLQQLGYIVEVEIALAAVLDDECLAASERAHGAREMGRASMPQTWNGIDIFEDAPTVQVP